MEVAPARSSSKPMTPPHSLPLPHDTALSSSYPAKRDAIWSGLASANSAPISRSSSMEVAPAMSSSEAVLLPHRLPLPHEDGDAYSASEDTVLIPLRLRTQRRMGGGPDPDSLEAEMEDLITALLGPMGRLLRRLRSFEDPEYCLPEGISANGIQLLREGLQGLYDYVKDVPDADLDAGVTPKWWIKEVRELGYDTEDFFDEVMQSCADGVVVGRGTISGIISKRRQRLPQIAEDFSHLMARADDARERCQSFQLAPETANKSEHGQAGISCHTPELLLNLPVSGVSSSDIHVDTAGCSPVGVEEPMKKLVKLLAFGDNNQRQLKVLPVLGSAGVGKTMVARTIYHQYGGEFQCRAFVRVSRNADMRWLLTSILSQIKAPQTHFFSDAQDLIDSIIKHLQGKRYFIVVDDLWTASVWDIISRAFPDGDRCSRILTTTQVEDVALACSGYESEYIFEMEPLNDGESRKLFFNTVFGSEGEGGCPKEFELVADGIIKKCGGLPLSTLNIASLLLPGKPNPAIQQWENVESALPSTLRTNPSSKGMKDVLILVYNKLPLRLKTCLLYVGMYPEGHTISKDDLEKQWVAESFVGDTEHGYFNELVRRGMIQPVDTNYHGEVLSCTVNHMALDLIRYKSMEDNFIITVNYLESILGLPDKARRLSVQFGGAKSAKIPGSIRISQVRSLFFCGFSRCAPSIPDYCLLRVLILHIWADQDKMSFDLTGIGELFHLRYVKVECDLTVDLPDKIQGLRYLETLQIDGRLSAVPSDIGNLEKLRHLRLPKQANVWDLGGLVNLQDLHLTYSTVQPVDNLEDNMKYLGSILEKLSNLKSVILASEGPLNTSRMSLLCDGLSSVSPALAHLERLELLPRICIFPSLPKWFKTLGKLCTLKITIRELLNSDIDIVKALPALSALSLYIQTAPVERIVFGKSGFSALKYFKLRCTEPLLKFEADAMPNLRKLKLVFNVQEVQQHGVAPICIEHLAGLKEISAKLGGAGAAGTESALRISVSNDPKNPKIDGQLVNWNFCADEDRIIATPDQAVVIMEEHGEILENTEYEYKREDVHRQPDSRISTQPESSPSFPLRPTDRLYGQRLLSAWSRARRTLKAVPRTLKARPHTLKAGYEGRNGLLWWHNLVPCDAGKLSMASVQANNLMEDHCRIESSPTFGTFIGIFDGHGGAEVARFTAEHLFTNLQSKATPSEQGMTAETIRNAFLDTDESFIALVEKQWTVKPELAAIGSCCLVGIVRQRTLFIANLGNSRAVLGKVDLNGQISPVQLSTEHVASDESVRRELRAQHPDDPHIVVLKHNVWRVKGIMQVTRTIGDAFLKHQRFNRGPLHSRFRLPEQFSRPILSADPSIISHSLQPSDRFIIFASDGLWEHLSNEKAIEIVHKHGRTGISRRLIEAALQEAAGKREMRYKDLKKIERGVRKHFHDDITVVVLFIEHGLSVKDKAQESPALSISVPSGVGTVLARQIMYDDYSQL